MKWPRDTRESQKIHAYRHLMALEFAIGLCEQKRTAIQAGGNIGLWPLRLSRDFQSVVTFEPEPHSYKCLVANTAAAHNIEVRKEALGENYKYCGIERRSLGSHRIIEGEGVSVIPLDSLAFNEVDLIQLDIEGYELHALRGAIDTIGRCHPVIQVEMRGFTEEYGESDDALIEFLEAGGYQEVSRQSGADVVFQYAG